METIKIYKAVKKETKTDNNNFIKFILDFNKETYHWATGREKQKGYCVTATPVRKGGMIEEFTAFQGFYEIIIPAERQSKKRKEQAEKLMLELIETKYKKHFESQGFVFIEESDKQ